jgi:hypothetical protein
VSQGGSGGEHGDLPDTRASWLPVQTALNEEREPDLPRESEKGVPVYTEVS